MGRLAKRSVLVTGAAGDLGRAIARACHAEGARVVVADLHREGVEALAQSLGGPDAGVLALTFDVRSPEAIEAAVHEAEAFAGGLDGLVNNAGVLSEASVLDLDAPSWDEVFAVNCRAPFLLARAVLPGMLAAGSGSIVNICSIESFVARPNHAAYGASKAALLNFTRAAAVEYGRQGVRSNAICPGSIAGGLFDEHVALFPDPAAVTAELVGRNYAGRLGRPDEVASAAVYLLGDESGFVNGSSIVIDGGRTAGT